jgi:hypothetical protein
MPNENETSTGRDRRHGSTHHVMPSRVVERSDPNQWGDHELLNFKEAVALFWPSGPLSVHSLRTAHRTGQLAVAEIAGKFFTTKAAITEMGLCVRKAEFAGPKGAVTNQDSAKARAAIMVENFKARMQDKLTK